MPPLRQSWEEQSAPAQEAAVPSSQDSEEKLLADAPLPEQQLQDLHEETYAIFARHVEAMQRSLDSWWSQEASLIALIGADAARRRLVVSSGDSDANKASVVKSDMYEESANGESPQKKSRLQPRFETDARSDYSERTETVSRSGTFAPNEWLSASQKYAQQVDIRAIFKDWLGVAWGPWKVMLQQFVESPCFLMMTGLLILLNAILIGFETDDSARHGTANPIFFLLQLLLNMWFSVEIVLRLAAWGFCNLFIIGVDRRWNVFDAFLVVMSLVDTASQSLDMDGAEMARLVKCVRLLRIARVMRLLRLMHYFQEFRKIFLLLATSVKTLLWSWTAVLFLLYIFAIFFTQTAADHLHSLSHDLQEAELRLKQDFGTLGSTLFTLYATISAGATDGRNWGSFMLDLAAIHWSLAGTFALFVSVFFFGVLNIVAGVFVECAMQSTQKHRDLLVEEKRSNERGHMRHMRTIFKEMDLDKTNSLAYDELRRALTRSPQLQDYFQALELNATDTLTLFKLLDGDGSGELTIDEFCDGCMRLKGEARAFDINCLIQEVHNIGNVLEKFMMDTHQKMDRFGSAMLCGSLDAGFLRGSLSRATPPTKEPGDWNPAAWEGILDEHER
uniref:EF-hand domain-containing protein n=1 Tax=Zooxanthella nutricula TaxID=1333877 RepID=A0A6U6H0F8_9DINO